MRLQELIDKISGQHVAILGKTGSGKTYTAKGIVEHLLDQKRQVCILDPTSAWWGLRLNAGGKPGGYKIALIGGAHADVPLNERSGEAVARLVTQQGASVVIDTGDMSVGEYTRWFIAFAGTLYATIRNPLHLVIDEAHHFMPQGKSPDVDAGRMLHAGNRLMSGGRSRGIRGMLITQRPAKLHKDSLTCADTLIAMRMIAPQDRQAVKDWVDGVGDAAAGRAVIESLASLPKGEGWVWYPEGSILDRVAFPPIRTFDSSATPKDGHRRDIAVGEIDLTEVRNALAEAVKDAEANDPKLLRAKIAELQKQLTAKPTPAKVETKIIEKPVVTDKQVKDVESIVTRLEREGQRRIDAGEQLAATGRELQITAKEFSAALRAASAPAPSVAARKVGVTHPTATITPRKLAVSDALMPSDIPKGERQVLIAIIQNAGDSGCDRQQLTVLTGFKRSTRDAYLLRLKNKGFITDNGQIFATDEGVAAAGEFETPPTGRALAAWWMSRLPEGERRILSLLIDNWPDAVDRETITAQTNFKRSTRDAYLLRLGSKRLVESSREGARASDLLFDAVEKVA